jgi:hypothetical protein
MEGFSMKKSRLIAVLLIVTMMFTAIPTGSVVSNPLGVSDAVEILKHVVGLDSVYDNSDFGPTIEDAVEILKFVVGLPSVHDVVSESELTSKSTLLSLVTELATMEPSVLTPVSVTSTSLGWNPPCCGNVMLPDWACHFCWGGPSFSCDVCGWEVYGCSSGFPGCTEDKWATTFGEITYITEPPVSVTSTIIKPPESYYRDPINYPGWICWICGGGMYGCVSGGLPGCDPNDPYLSIPGGKNQGDSREPPTTEGTTKSSESYYPGWICWICGGGMYGCVSGGLPGCDPNDPYLSIPGGKNHGGLR